MSIEISTQRVEPSKPIEPDDNAKEMLQKEKKAAKSKRKRRRRNEPINTECAHCWVRFESIECVDFVQKETAMHL